MYHIAAKTLKNNPKYMYCTCTLQMAIINNSTLHIQQCTDAYIYMILARKENN